MKAMDMVKGIQEGVYDTEDPRYVRLPKDYIVACLVELSKRRKAMSRPGGKKRG